MWTRWAIAAAALLCACSPTSPDEQLLKAIEPATEWAPSLQMTAEKWLANSVPARFVAKCAEAADSAAGKALKSVESSKASPALRDSIRRELTGLRNASSSLQHAATTGDRRAAQRLIPPLRTLHQHFDALEKQ